MRQGRKKEAREGPREAGGPGKPKKGKQIFEGKPGSWGKAQRRQGSQGTKGGRKAASPKETKRESSKGLPRCLKESGVLRGHALEQGGDERPG